VGGPPTEHETTPDGPSRETRALGFLNLPSTRHGREPGPDVVGRGIAVFLLLVAGVVLGLQYWLPNPRVIPVIAAILLFGIAWRMDMVASLGLVVLLLPYPKGTVFGSSNLALVLLVFIIWLLRLSLRMSPPARSGPLYLPIFGMLLWSILSFYNVRSSASLFLAFQNFEIWIACLLLYFLVVNCVRTPRDLERLHDAQLVTAFVVFALAALEAREAGRIIIPGLIDFQSTRGHDFNTRDVRVGSSFRDYELLSEYCGLTLLLTAFRFMRAKSQTRRWLLGMFTLFNVYTMFTTVTRGVIVALAVTLPYVFYVIRRRLNPVRFMTATFIIIVLAVTMNGIVAKYTNSGDMFLRLSETKVVHGVVPEAREGAWTNAWKRSLLHPILGQGPYYDEIPGFEWLWPHNVYLYVANLYGFPGMLFFIVFLVGLGVILRPVVNDLKHASYADAYLIIARTQLFMFALNEIKIDYLRNSIYSFQVWLMFGMWTAAYLVSREHGVRAGNFIEAAAPPPERPKAA